MQVTDGQCGCVWSSDTSDIIEKEMFQTFVSGAGLSGLMALVLEERHLGALDSTMAMLLRRRMTGGRMS
eukprot:5202445-Pyramimonas_sp.AAC.1